LAHWTITQRTIHVVLPNKLSVLRHDKLHPTAINTLGSLLVARRKKAGLTQQKLTEMTGFHRQWLGRWERGRALPSPADWAKLRAVLSIPANPTFQ
jgi:DNA-binding transcriptional regulator YiaG